MSIVLGLLLAGIDAGLIYAMIIGNVAVSPFSVIIAIVIGVLAVMLILGGSLGSGDFDCGDFGGGD